ncbi:MAG: carboxymuconolactone decarboxylase family protein [Geminicoccaceae bacterium]
MKNYVELGKNSSATLKLLRDAAPSAMKGFGGLHHGAMADGALDVKTKELIALAIAVAVRCDGCIAHHARACVAAGATREEVSEMLGVAVLMGGGPATIYGADALLAFDQYKEA